MQYNMPIYLCVFLPAVLGGYYLTPKKYRWAVLLLASFAFYLITGGALIVFILASSLFIYAAGLWLENKPKIRRYHCQIQIKHKEKQ